MAEHLRDNIYQVGGAKITHELDGASYLIHDEQSPNDSVLIDCGSPLGYEKLVKQLASLDVDADKISTVFATHGHFDHTAAASFMGRAVLHINEGDRFAVETGDYNLTASFLYNFSFPPTPRVESLYDDTEITVGGTKLRALHTPGHTPGSTCFKLTTASGRRVLIAGDTLWGGFEKRIRSNKELWRQSLDRLLLDEFDDVTFGHGINFLVPNAMAHLALASTRFMVAPRISHGGEYIDPWPELR